MAENPGFQEDQVNISGFQFWIDIQGGGGNPCPIRKCKFLWGKDAWSFLNREGGKRP